MSFLTIHEIKYYLPMNQEVSGRMQWINRYFNAKEAEAFIASLEESDLISYKVIETTSALFTEAINTPYRYLAGTYVKIGDLYDAKCSYRTSAFTTQELFDVAQAEFDKLVANDRKHQDRYYDQQWV